MADLHFNLHGYPQTPPGLYSTPPITCNLCPKLSLRIAALERFVQMKFPGELEQMANFFQPANMSMEHSTVPNPLYVRGVGVPIGSHSPAYRPALCVHDPAAYHHFLAAQGMPTNTTVLNGVPNEVPVDFSKAQQSQRKQTLSVKKPTVPSSPTASKKRGRKRKYPLPEVPASGIAVPLASFHAMNAMNGAPSTSNEKMYVPGPVPQKSTSLSPAPPTSNSMMNSRNTEDSTAIHTQARVETTSTPVASATGGRILDPKTMNNLDVLAAVAFFLKHGKLKELEEFPNAPIRIDELFQNIDQGVGVGETGQDIPPNLQQQQDSSEGSAMPSESLQQQNGDNDDNGSASEYPSFSTPLKIIKTEHVDVANVNTEPSNGSPLMAVKKEEPGCLTDYENQYYSILYETPEKEIVI